MFNKLANKKVKIVEKFKIFIAVSILILGIGIIMLAVKGMNVGIDFSGGAQLDIELSSFASNDKAKDIIDTEITKILDENGCRKVGALQTSQSQGGVTYEYRLEYYHNGELKGEEQEIAFMEFVSGENGLCDQIQTKLEEIFAGNSDLTALGATIEESAVKAHSVGATASGALLRNATIALSVAIVVMLIYIVIRFTPSSAFAAVCALAHDVLIMVALTVIFQIPVNSTFIAAVITIVGYSINATIVIFDRIREGIKFNSDGKTDAEIANESIVKTLGRSILTTLTTLLMVLFLAFLSVSTIREFIIPIIFGLIAGTYSSIFLASSFWVMFRKIGAKKRAEKKSSGYKKAVKG